MVCVGPILVLVLCIVACCQALISAPVRIFGPLARQFGPRVEVTGPVSLAGNFDPRVGSVRGGFPCLAADGGVITDTEELYKVGDDIEVLPPSCGRGMKTVMKFGGM